MQLQINKSQVISIITLLSGYFGSVFKIYNLINIISKLVSQQDPFYLSYNLLVYCRMSFYSLFNNLKNDVLSVSTQKDDFENLLCDQTQ